MSACHNVSWLCVCPESRGSCHSPSPACVRSVHGYLCVSPGGCTPQRACLCGHLCVHVCTCVSLHGRTSSPAPWNRSHACRQASGHGARSGAAAECLGRVSVSSVFLLWRDFNPQFSPRGQNPPEHEHSTRSMR